MDINSEQLGRDLAKGFVETLSNKFDPSAFVKGFSGNAQQIGHAFGGFFKGVAQAGAEANDDFGISVGSTFLKRYLPLMILAGLATVALPLTYRYIHAVMMRNIGKPTMALKDRRTTWMSQIKNIFKSNQQKPAPKPIFKKDLEDRVKDIVDSTNNIKKNASFFQNVILYGPGGTGKTMLAEMIATNSDMDYIMMSGGELGQFIKRGEHVSEFNNLWKAAEKSKKPTVIFVDEAEGLCKSRNALDQEHLELQNTFLNRTGTPNKQIMLILATNRIDDIDPAILNRMTHKIHIDHPGLEERVKIIDMYVKQFFEDVQEREQIFTSAVLIQMAQKTEKFSGRTLFQMINAICAKKGSSKDNQISREMIENVVDIFSKQEKNFQV